MEGEEEFLRIGLERERGDGRPGEREEEVGLEIERYFIDWGLRLGLPRGEDKSA